MKCPVSVSGVAGPLSSKDSGAFLDDDCSIAEWFSELRDFLLRR